MISLVFVSEKASPALSPLTAVDAPDPDCAAEGAQSPTTQEGNTLKVEKIK